MELLAHAQISFIVNFRKFSQIQVIHVSINPIESIIRPYTFCLCLCLNLKSSQKGTLGAKLAGGALHIKPILQIKSDACK